MQQSNLKTSLKQRIIIGVIALILIASSIIGYALAIISNQTTAETNRKTSELQIKFTEKRSELTTAYKELSDRYFKEFSSFRSFVKGFNAANAEAGGIVKQDLKIGDGEILTPGKTDYLAYYIGFCPNEKIFDSSLNSLESPTGLIAPFAPTAVIEGWSQGVIGMKLGGVRLVTMPSGYAYKEDDRLCGVKNSPLKFIIMAIAEDDKIKQIKTELNSLDVQLQSLKHGIIR